MYGIYVFALYAIGICMAGRVPTRQKLKIVVPEQEVQATHSLVSLSSGGHDFDDGDFGGGQLAVDGATGKSSSGAELTSLAHSSAQQANNAVQNQRTAGSQAAFGITSSLASAALGAAQTAQAALVGKRAIVQNLRRQLQEAHSQVQEEISLLHQVEAAASAALTASQQAQEQVNAISSAVVAAQSGAQSSERAASEAANAASAQLAMVAEAKQRLARVLGQLHSALGDLQETEGSALRAAEAAQQAQSNAAAAGLAVAAASAKGSNAGGSSLGGSSFGGSSHHRY